MRRIPLLLLLCVLASCRTEAPLADYPEEKCLEINLTAHPLESKTSISDSGIKSSFSFETGNELGFFADGIFSNVVLTCTDGNTGSFSGNVLVQGAQTVHRASVSYYAYYPYVKASGNNPASLVGTLPARQKAPFDGGADYLVATPQTDVYDIDNFPALSFTFGSHLFAIVKLSVTNSSAELADEKILSIGLRSTEKALAGEFRFNATDPSTDAVFTDNENYLHNTVLAEFEESSRPTLGTGDTHSVYVVVNAADYTAGSLSLVVKTSNHVYSLPTKSNLTLSRNKVTVFPQADIATASTSGRQRTMVLWGDSITNGALQQHIQEQLGEDWTVILGGVSGDNAQVIASRQGGIDMVTGTSPINLPASSAEYVDIDNLYCREGTEGAYTYGLRIVHRYSFETETGAQLNPLIINGVSCEISYDTNLNQCRLRRLEDGDPMVIAPRTEVSTYGSRTYTNVDCIVVYMGTNGRKSSPGPADNARLIELHDAMLAHMTNPESKMFVYGFHQSTTDHPMYWSQDYVDAFTSHYGPYFIDQRTEAGGLNAIPLMKEMGQITDEFQISEKDLTYINRGDWPLSWFKTSVGDVHPNAAYGSQVMAILLRRRMEKLGML